MNTISAHAVLVAVAVAIAEMNNVEIRIVTRMDHVLCNCLTDVTFALRELQCGIERFPQAAQRGHPARTQKIGCSVLDHQVSTRLFVRIYLNTITQMLTTLNFGFTVTEELPKRVLLILLHEQQRKSIESALRGAGLEVSIASERKSVEVDK